MLTHFTRISISLWGYKLKYVDGEEKNFFSWGKRFTDMSIYTSDGVKIVINGVQNMKKEPYKLVERGSTSITYI